LSPEILAVIEKKSEINRNRTFAQYDAKVYPSDLMQEVIDQLALDTTNTILLLAVEQKKLKFWIRLLLIKKTSSIWRETQTATRITAHQ
jgi:hypothetical protein